MRRDNLGREHALLMILSSIIITLAFLQPALSDITFKSYCVTKTGCVSGLDSPDTCRSYKGGEGISRTLDPEVNSDQSREVEGVFYWPRNDVPLLCETGCCTTDQGFQQEQQKITCEENGGTWNPGECTGDVLCLHGETNCVCEGVKISEPEYCCMTQEGNYQISETACDTSITPPGNDIINILDYCGNGVWDYQAGEICEYTAQGDEQRGSCPYIQGQQGNPCTQNCRCAVTLPDPNDDDDLCSLQGDNDCLETPSCENTPSIAATHTRTETTKAKISLSFDSTSCDNSIISSTAEVTNLNTGIIQHVTLDGGVGEYEVEDNNEYQAIVSVTFNTRTGYETLQATAQPNPLRVKDDSCMAGKTSYCISPTEYTYCNDNVDDDSCDEQGNCACPTGLQCLDSRTGHACLEEVNCELCNGPYEEFGEVSEVKISTPNGMLTCEKIQQNAETDPDFPTYCFLDARNSAAYAYTSCLEVIGCDDYKTQTTCDNNPCILENNCAWHEKVGCYDTEDPGDACELLTQDVCEQVTGCVWDGVDTCISQNQASCDYFSTEEACTGGGEGWSMNIDNSEKTRSNNVFNLRKCRWSTFQGSTFVCRKDSDADNNPETLETDMEDPVTTLLFDPNTVFVSEIRIPYTTSEEVLATYAEITPSTNGECPLIDHQIETTASTNPKEIIYTLEDSAEGTYCLYYYSKDSSSNLEVVKTQSLRVDNTPLQVSVSIKQYPWPEQNTTSLEINFTLSEVAVCSAQLQKITGDQPIIYNPVVTNLRAQKFGTYTYLDLPNAEYKYKISCVTAQNKQLEHEEIFTLNTDQIIIGRQPPVSTYTKDNLLQMSIMAKQAQSCDYLKQSQWISFQQQQDQGDSVKYSSSIPEQQTGVYYYPVRCLLDEGNYYYGNDASNILFAIDNQPPALTLTTKDANGEQVSIEGLYKPYDSTVNIICEDPKITGYDQDWEFGNCKVYQKTTNGDLLLNQDTISVEPGNTVTLYAVDGGGNKGVEVTIEACEENINCHLVEEDISGPERPEFTVVS